MVTVIRWNQKALRRLNHIYSFWKSQDAQKACVDFDLEIDKKLNVLVDWPEIGSLVNSAKNLRFVRLKRHFRMYYRVNGKVLTVVDFFDTRQNPDKSPY